METEFELVLCIPSLCMNHDSKRTVLVVGPFSFSPNLENCEIWRVAVWRGPPRGWVLSPNFRGMWSSSHFNATCPECVMYLSIWGGIVRCTNMMYCAWYILHSMFGTLWFTMYRVVFSTYPCQSASKWVGGSQFQISKRAIASTELVSLFSLVPP